MPNESTKNVTLPNETFRFAHLSDLHISSPGIPAPWKLANKRVLGYLSWLKKRRYNHKISIADIAINQLKQTDIDHYVITGDLTHIGLKKEFQQITSWLNKVGSGEDITVIPGNHDLYVNESWHHSFAQWESYMQADTPARLDSAPAQDALTRLESMYPVVRIRGNTAFICLSSIFNAPWFRATGRVNDDQLKRLEKLLQDPALDQLCKVLLIHHPITLTHTRARKSLLNYTHVLDVLRHSSIHLVLHGHGHQSTYERIQSHTGNNIEVIGASSSSTTNQKDKYQAEFLIFEISNAAQSWHICVRNFLFNCNQQRFIEAHQQSFNFSKKL
jgi:3',5'-cyclic AMP phosphodiesterase CpdA